MRNQIRWTALTTFVVLLLLLCIFMVMSCTSNDDYDDHLPPYQKTLCELLTDTAGVATIVRFDDGHEAPLLHRVKDLTPDSVYRITATTLQSAEGVELYNASYVFAPMPQKIKAEDMVTDPVEVLTAWRDLRYVNMRLRVTRAAEAGHYMGFADMGVKHNTDGTRVRTVKFYHDRNGDSEYYRQETLISLPIYQMSSELRPGVDSVRLVVNTPNGEQNFTCLY